MIISYCNKSPSSQKLIRYLCQASEDQEFSELLSLSKMLIISVFKYMKNILVMVTTVDQYLWFSLTMDSLTLKIWE